MNKGKYLFLVTYHALFVFEKLFVGFLVRVSVHVHDHVSVHDCFPDCVQDCFHDCVHVCYHDCVHVLYLECVYELNCFEHVGPLVHPGIL